jgi:hypothetical protein
LIKSIKQNVSSSDSSQKILQEMFTTFKTSIFYLNNVIAFLPCSPMSISLPFFHPLMFSFPLILPLIFTLVHGVNTKKTNANRLITHDSLTFEVRCLNKK